jgi:hypothetical protein
MVHLGGFTPWHFKYTNEGSCGDACKHGGVETEWETAKVTSSFNVFVDADACCTVGTMVLFLLLLLLLPLRTSFCLIRFSPRPTRQ